MLLERVYHNHVHDNGANGIVQVRDNLPYLGRTPPALNKEISCFAPSLAFSFLP